MTLLANLQPEVLHWLVLSSLLFSIGLYGLLTRRNVIGVLISIELMLNAGAMNFVILNRYVMPGHVDGQAMALFIVATAAAEVVVAMAIVVGLFRHTKTTDVTRINMMWK